MTHRHILGAAAAASIAFAATWASSTEETARLIAGTVAATVSVACAATATGSPTSPNAGRLSPRAPKTRMEMARSQVPRISIGSLKPSLPSRLLPRCGGPHPCVTAAVRTGLLPHSHGHHSSRMWRSDGGLVHETCSYARRGNKGEGVTGRCLAWTPSPNLRSGDLSTRWCLITSLP